MYQWLGTHSTFVCAHENKRLAFDTVKVRGCRKCCQLSCCSNDMKTCTYLKYALIMGMSAPSSHDRKLQITTVCWAASVFRASAYCVYLHHSSEDVTLAKHAYRVRHFAPLFSSPVWDLCSRRSEEVRLEAARLSLFAPHFCKSGSAAILS